MSLPTPPASPPPPGVRSGRARRRLLLTAGVALALACGAVAGLPTRNGGEQSLRAEAEERTAARVTVRDAVRAATGHEPAEQLLEGGDPADAEAVARAAAEAGDLAEAVAGGTDDGHGHSHSDPATTNAISRSSEVGELTEDPTTPEQAARNRAHVASERTGPAPTLTTVPVRPPRHRVPRTRYEMASGCYALAGQPVFFQATDLGRYLLFTRDRRFVGGAGTEAAASASTDWVTHKVAPGRFTFRLADGRALRRTSSGFATGSTPTAFALTRTSGCARHPEISVNVSGRPHAGVNPFQEVRGFVDPHTHGQTHEFLGGRVICSPPWHRYGVAHALVDCPDHEVLGGRGAILEDVVSGNTPGSGHDPVGWPTFRYWPDHHSLTHQQLYYKWLERSWRGGLRLWTSLLTENNVLCELYPLKKNSCDDRDAVRLQARRMREMQRYIDAQYGGPGKGWYRIVTNPFQARKVINQGKLAVVMGMETSVPFGCNVKFGRPTCTAEDVDRGLDEARRLGISQMEILNKFDNAFTGVAGDGGSIGTITNAANFYNTGSWLRMETCPAAYGPGVHDHEQGPLTAPAEMPAQDAIFGALGQLYGLTGALLPLYPKGPHCNKASLTPLGRHLLDGMMERNILFDPDHMSVYARKEALSYLEQAARNGRHPGVVSSHSWSTPDAYPRIYRLGGFVAPYAGDSTGFLAKWREHQKWADSRYFFGFGYGADMNGFGSQGGPRGADVPNPVRYPFTGFNGVTVRQQRSGQRVYDINRDGVDHYGLYPDWIRDVQVLAGAEGDAFLSDMARGPEAYLQTWERAYGLRPDSCRNPGLRVGVGRFTGIVRPGMGAVRVMRAVGQPWARPGGHFTYCARTATGAKAVMKVSLSRAGVVTSVRRVR